MLKSLMQHIVSLTGLEVDLTKVVISTKPKSSMKTPKTQGWVSRSTSGNMYHIVVLNTLKGNKLASVVAHELRHVEQYQTGKLERIDGIFLWKGLPISKRTTDYCDLPWEIDAHGFEVTWLIARYKHAIINMLPTFLQPSTL